jgi:16S rRNA G966 N2-methylase RsmD
MKGLNTLSRQGKKFDIVLFDPPYSSDLYTVVPEGLSSLSLFSDEGLLVAECSARAPLVERYGMFVRIDRRVYGDTAIEFFVRERT